ncbi:MAG: MCE family protein [Ignavibacteria bacterium]|nr:MCE family protein [Ignavibacteria bacterium]
MKKEYTKKIIVGLFILIGFIIFLVTIFVIGSKKNLFTSTFILNTFFENVSGLKEGNSVYYNGINVGTVTDIFITDVNRVQVTMTIDSKVKPFIKKDSKVSIVTEGLVGNKIVEISAGSVLAISVDDYDFLESIKPISTEDILKSLKETSENASKLTGDLAEITQKINKGEGTIGMLINNESIYTGVDSALRSIASQTGDVNSIINSLQSTINDFSNTFNYLAEDVKKVTHNITEITDKMNSQESVVGTLFMDTTFASNVKSVIIHANKTTQNLERGAFSFYQNMEALKHNFLFKGYFEDIGYWDKTDFEKYIDEKQEDIKKKEEELKKMEKKLDQLMKDFNKKIEQLPPEEQEKIKKELDTNEQKIKQQ